MPTTFPTPSASRSRLACIRLACIRLAVSLAVCFVGWNSSPVAGAESVALRMPTYADTPPPPLRPSREVAGALRDSVPASGPRRRNSWRVVLVAGPKDHDPGEHDYPAWQQVWQPLLRSHHWIDVQTAWEFPTAEQLASADVLVFYQRGTWNADRAKAVDAFLAKGGGCVYLHWAVDGRAEKEAFAQRIGLASQGGTIAYRHGPLSIDFSPGAGHPIARNLKKVAWLDETYWKLTGDPSRTQVLGTSLEDDHPRPQFWTLDHHPGRVFVSIPGHYMWTFDDPLYRLLLFRGILWAGKLPVDALNDRIFCDARLDVPFPEDRQWQPPAQTPKEAVVLLDAKTNRFLHKTGVPSDWHFEAGTLQVATASNQNHAVSDLHFRDADLHVEFRTPQRGSGNSGIYLHGHYELQIYNSQGRPSLSDQDLGAVYGFAAPSVDAAQAAGTWQVYDARYRAPRRDAQGQIVDLGQLTVWLNGQRVQSATCFAYPRSVFHPFRYGSTAYLTGLAEQLARTGRGPMFLQDHGQPVEFRNIWVRPLDDQYSIEPVRDAPRQSVPLPQSSTEPPPMEPKAKYDLSILRGTLVDGSGAAARAANVYIEGDRIAAVTSVDDVRPARRVLNAEGHVVCPGFIDPHAHGDPFRTPEFGNFLSMGVTTLCLGQDGECPDDPSEWLQRVREQPLGPNVLLMAGHGTARRAVGIDETPHVSPAQREALQEWIRRALQAGCWGLTTGLEYQPGAFAQTEELMAIAEPVAAVGGILMSHLRSEDDDRIEAALDELLMQGRETGCRVHVSHLKITYGRGADRADQLLHQLQRAREAGVQVTADLYPYLASFTGIGIVFPDWAKPPQDYAQVVQTRREELAEYLRRRVTLRNGPEATLLATSPWTGRTLAEVAASLEKPFEDVLIDDIGLERGVRAAYFVMDEELQTRFLKDPHVMICSDGSPTMRHPRGHGAFAK